MAEQRDTCTHCGWEGFWRGTRVEAAADYAEHLKKARPKCPPHARREWGKETT